MIEYKFTTGIIFDRLQILLEELKRRKAKSLLIISSPSVIEIPEVKNFTEAVSKNYHLSIFSNVRPDAPIGYLDQIISESTKPDVIIGIGGGSVIDSSKALSLGWQGSTVTELFYKLKTIPTNNIPVIAVPTTAGTGAELSYGAILYDAQTKKKDGIRGSILQPTIALIDVELYTYAPQLLMAEVGFDCLTHAIETYVSVASSELVKYQSVAAINVVLQHLYDATFGSTEALGKVALAAAIMGQNLALSSTCLPHRIQYSLGPKTQTSHAKGLIALYKGWLFEIESTNVFNKLATDLGFQSGSQFIQAITELKSRLNINYTLSSFGVSQADIGIIADDVTGNLHNDPSYESKQTILNILLNSI
jgi:alcohol dehydrogenase class IV